MPGPTGLESREETEVDSESGSKVIRFGSEDAYLTGMKEYRFSYTVTPRFQENAYQNAYYNVFPTQWQNRIPAGSRFTITFPKEFPHDILEFYYGTYGENKNAAAILDDLAGKYGHGHFEKRFKTGGGNYVLCAHGSWLFHRCRAAYFPAMAAVIAGRDTFAADCFSFCEIRKG